MSPNFLVLFDIDGTLVLTGRAGMRAMNRACEETVGHANALSGVAVAGRTDWIILHDVMANHGLSLDDVRLEELRRLYVRYLADEIVLPGEGVKDVMPGIRALLDRLEGRSDVALGKAHLGLRGVRERLILVHGRLEIESTPNGGTTVYACVPIGEGAEQ